MTSPHIAHTVEDVRRLAPVEGVYWTRRAQSSVLRAGPWDVARLFVGGDSGREWAIPGADGFVEDEGFAGDEIIGPIPEPGT